MTFAMTISLSIVAVGLAIAACCVASLVIDGKEVRK